LGKFKILSLEIIELCIDSYKHALGCRVQIIL